jgi:hypothetical protein
MQYIESSIIGIRSAVITLKRRETPLRFILFPMVHIGEPEFFRTVEARAAECDLIVAEGAPSRYAPIHAWMSQFRFDNLVDQLTALDLDALGVPVRWEYDPEPKLQTSQDRIKARATDAAGAIILKALGRFGSPLGVPSLDQSDDHDDRWDHLGGGRFERTIVQRLLHDRDAQLTRALGEAHEERCQQPGKVAVVWGAAHIPAAVDYLTETLRYYVEDATWLMVANAPS